MAEAEVNAATLELIERRLAETVEARVRERLFRYYRAIWGTATAVLAVLGVSVVAWVYARAEGWAVAAIQPTVKEAAAVLTSAEAGLEDADGQIRRMDAQLDAIDDFLGRREDAMAGNDQRLRESQARVAALSAEVEASLGGLLERIADNTAQLAAIEARAGDTARLGNIEDLRAKLDTVAQQVLLLHDSVVAAGGPGGDVEPTGASVDTVALEAIVAPPDQRADPSAPAAGTVFFQFAGVERAVAGRIAGALADQGYEMPGEERTGAAAGLHEVRFYFAEDAARAARLADDANRVLAGQGLAAEVTAEDFTGYAGQKPRGGILELWLEPVPAAPPRGGALEAEGGAP